MPSIALLYGLGEGPAVGKSFRSVFERAGFTFVDDIAKADIVIAHSGGCFFLPDDLKDARILLIAPSFARNHKSLLATQAHKVARDFMYTFRTRQFFRWIYKSLWNGVYLIREPKKLVYMWKACKQPSGTLPQGAWGKVTIIAYREDPWSGYFKRKTIDAHPAYRFMSLEGVHDDIWIHPEKYLTIVQS